MTMPTMPRINTRFDFFGGMGACAMFGMAGCAIAGGAYA